MKITTSVSLWWSSGILQKKKNVDQQCTNKQHFIVLQWNDFHHVKFMKNETKEIQRIIKQSRTNSKKQLTTEEKLYSHDQNKQWIDQCYKICPSFTICSNQNSISVLKTGKTFRSAMQLTRRELVKTQWKPVTRSSIWLDRFDARRYFN